MSTISPFLDAQLNQWTERGTTLQKEVQFQNELLGTTLLSLDSQRRSFQQRRARDLSDLQRRLDELHTRWTERLSRSQQWQQTLADLRFRREKLSGLQDSAQWFERAENALGKLMPVLQHRFEILKERQSALHLQMTGWVSLLEERQRSVQELKDKGIDRPQRLLVSRSRKQLEVHFLQEQRHVTEALNQTLQGLRSTLNYYLNRLQRTYRALDERASGHTISLELHKKELTSGLDPLREKVYKLREDILSEALQFEAGRRILRSIQETVNSLRCVEDAYPKKSTFLERLFPIE